jgi:hypothetical protein
MESYPESYPEVRKSLNSFLANIVHDMAIERTHIKDAQTVQVEGTSYMKEYLQT